MLNYYRYAKAKRDIHPGELILKEKPLFIGGPITGIHQCFKCCIKLIKDVYVCGRCHVATICSKECKGNSESFSKIFMRLKTYYTKYTQKDGIRYKKNLVHFYI